jgi:hypothetical protein
LPSLTRPKATERRLEMIRPMVSVAEPGVKGTMIRIGFDGKACASPSIGSNVQRLAKLKDAAIS